VINRVKLPHGRGPNRRRSEDREFTADRCLIIADGFYEFTDLLNPEKKRKDKWLFTKKDEPWFCIVGLWRTDPDAGEAFTMLNMDPVPDMAPIRIAKLRSSIAPTAPTGWTHRCRRRAC